MLVEVNQGFMGVLIVATVVILVAGWMILMTPTAKMNARKNFSKRKGKYLPGISGEAFKMNKTKNPYSF
jgi:hypothetical protein